MSIKFGDETVTIVEIDQPFCLETYSVAPCTAALGTTGTKKCYNSRFTCQDAPNYNPEDRTLKFSFAQEDMQQYGLVIPSLVKVSTSPLQVNIGGIDPDMGAFGERETVNLTFDDHKHSDHFVDKYRTERPNAHGQSGVAGFKPYDQGSFWGKWLIRNPYHEGYPVRISEGRLGDLQSEMRVRHYVIDSIDGPSRGRVNIKLKDLFSLVEERKTQAPVANTGELDANITSGAGSATLAPTGIGNTEYAASGRVAIDSEIMDFTRSGDVLTLTARGVLNTVAKSHEAEDKVQEIKEYSAQRPDTIIKDLLTNFAEIDIANIPVDEWKDEVDAFLPTLYTAFIAEPTSVIDLIGELAEQVGFTLWPDVDTNLIQLRSVGANVVPVVTIDDDNHIIAESMVVTREPDQRVSRVQIFYGQINPLEGLKDEKNYFSRVEARDVAAESSDEYGTKSIRKVFSRWIPQFGRTSAEAISDLILALFRDPPFRAEFDNDVITAGLLEVAKPFILKTRAVVDDQGFVESNTLLPMTVSRGETKIIIKAQKLNITQPVGTDRIINIDDDVNNVNMRTLHDSLFIPPISGTVVKFVIGAGVKVGADGTTGPAMETGTWPTGVVLSLEIKATAFLCGAGGKGGAGNGFSPPGAGAVGKLAFKVDFAITVINNGVIGGGGGGGGGYRNVPLTLGMCGGGGAGCNDLVGFDQVRGGKHGNASGTSFRHGSDGTIDTGGAGAVEPLLPGEGGGNGGALGAVGAPGKTHIDGQKAGGGAAGDAVDGDSLVTYTPVGDIRGARIN